MDTLPDYLREGLDVVFVGINPGSYSARVGHYFATPQNRFWRALNRSGLVPGRDDLGPEDDALMPDYGIGFTDVVKRASNSASSLRAADWRLWAPQTKEKLLRFAPLVVCFHGDDSCRFRSVAMTEAPDSGTHRGVAYWCERVGTRYMMSVSLLPNGWGRGMKRLWSLYPGADIEWWTAKPDIPESV